jgi:general secretion pathway protein J
MTRGSQGFTLVEVLIALAILSIAAALAYRGTAALVDGEVRLAAEAARWRTLDAVFARLEADVRQAQPRAVRVGATREPAWFATPDARGNSVIVFSRAGPEFDADPGAAGQRVGYRLREGALEVLYWPSLDREPGTKESSWQLVTGVAGFRVEHRSGSGQWIDAWPRAGEPETPAALRVTVALESGEMIERWFALR